MLRLTHRKCWMLGQKSNGGSRVTWAGWGGQLLEAKSKRGAGYLWGPREVWNQTQQKSCEFRITWALTPGGSRRWGEVGVGAELTPHVKLPILLAKCLKRRKQELLWTKETQEGKFFFKDVFILNIVKFPSYWFHSNTAFVEHITRLINELIAEETKRLVQAHSALR